MTSPTKSELAAVAAEERAWRDGWATCKASLTDDEASCLTDDVEQDAWLDSDTCRAALAQHAPDTREGETMAREWINHHHSDVGHPNDRDYDTDELIDAFIAGRESATPGFAAGVESAAQAAYQWWDGEPEDAEDLRTHIRALTQARGKAPGGEGKDD